jgi:hypothetical protein
VIHLFDHHARLRVFVTRAIGDYFGYRAMTLVNYSFVRQIRSPVACWFGFLLFAQRAGARQLTMESSAALCNSSKEAAIMRFMIACRQKPVAESPEGIRVAFAAKVSSCGNFRAGVMNERSAA